MFKCRKKDKTVGRRSANERMIEDFLNEKEENTIKGFVYVKEGVVISRKELK